MQTKKMIEIIEKYEKVAKESTFDGRALSAVAILQLLKNEVVKTHENQK